MANYSIVLFIFITTISWSFEKQHVQLKKIDYTNYGLITSSLPRTQRAAKRTKFNWNDFGIEKEWVEEMYMPKLDFSFGSPNYMPPQTVVQALIDVASNTSHPRSYETHQYTRTMGHPDLVLAVAKLHSPLMKRDIHPFKEILITCGSVNSMDLISRSYIDPGDEVIVFEPFYFDYINFVHLNDGKLIPVPLRPKSGTTGHSSNDLTFDKSELESKITHKTKIIWLNNPNNPTGKAFTIEELTYLGDLAKKHDLLIVSDEAAQWYIYEEPQHTRIATLPGLFERTLTLTSGGKTFSNTGWRIGWIIGPEPLLWPMASMVEPTLSSVSTSMQMAFALGIEREIKLMGTPQSHFTVIKNQAKKSRDMIVSILKSVGAEVVVPTSAYCIMANFTKLVDQIDLSSIVDDRPGMKLYKYFMKKGLGTFPLSIMYSEQNAWKAEYSLRFTNFKTEPVINELAQLLPTIFKPVK